MALVDDPVKRPGGHTRSLIENALDGECACRPGEPTRAVGHSGNFLDTDDTGLGRRSPLSDKRGVQAVPVGCDEPDAPGCRTRRQSDGRRECGGEATKMGTRSGSRPIHLEEWGSDNVFLNCL